MPKQLNEYSGGWRAKRDENSDLRAGEASEGVP